MNLCTPDDLKDYLLEAYLTACEAQNPGLAERTIEAVSGEILEMLEARYPQPWQSVPRLIRYIASVISAYRTAGAITSLVTTDGSTGNDWLPLQKEWKRATDMLDKLATGKMHLTAPDDGTGEEPGQPEAVNGTMAIVTQTPLFDFRGF